MARAPAKIGALRVEPVFFDVAGGGAGHGYTAEFFTEWRLHPRGQSDQFGALSGPRDGRNCGYGSATG